MSAQKQQKQAAAQAALAYITDDMTVGVGTGSTVNYFIDALTTIKHKINAAVPSSLATEQRLKDAGIPIISLNAAGPIPLYVDGADEATHNLQLIKGGGGALTREKVLAGAARQFICIIDQSKYVDRLGAFPLPIAVLPMARSFVAREIVKLGGDPVYRDGFATDDGHVILDVHNMDILEPMGTETAINNIPGVIANGLFTLRPADQLLIGTKDGSVQRVT